MYSMLKSTLLLLLAARLSQSQLDDNLCPAPSDIYPCKCSSSSLGLDVRCDGGMHSIYIEDLHNAFEILYGKKINYLALSDVNMEKASLELFNGLVMEKVRFDSTKFVEMPDLKGSENTLEGLAFDDAVSEKSLQNFSLKVSHLNKLKSFTFKHYMLLRRGFDKTTSVGNDWFGNGPSSLETIDFQHNRIKSLGDRVFSELPNLKKIDFSSNLIEEVHRSMFPNPAEHLLSIRLGFNCIKYLPKDIFSHMPVLNKVDVWENSIKVLDERTWKPVWEQLDYLHVGKISYGFTCDWTINWTFELSRPNELYGICSRTDESYREYRGRHLADIIDKKQKQGQ